jgi:hypothetical protein
MMRAPNRAWTTEDEIMFIASLGAHSAVLDGLNWRDRHAALLDGYRAGTSKRMDWAGLDPKRIGEACRE